MKSSILKESLVIVLTGTVVNYPLSLFFLYLFIDILEVEGTFWVGTLTTLAMTITAFIRVYYIRSFYGLPK